MNTEQHVLIVPALFLHYQKSCCDRSYDGYDVPSLKFPDLTVDPRHEVPSQDIFRVTYVTSNYSSHAML